MKLSKLSSSGNFHELLTSKCQVFFSYETAIAVVRKGAVHVCRNEWGRITGRHINIVKLGAPSFKEVEHDELLHIIESYEKGE